MSDELVSIPYTSDMLDRIRDFDYGSEPYQRELSDGMIRESETAMVLGTKIWLYINRANSIVGFGSLGQTNWKYPDSASQRAAIALIPAVAIRKEYWGKPITENRDERYSSQILAELLRQAAEWPGLLPAVGLYVHPDNHSAIKLYERFHFRRFHTLYTDKTSGVTYLGFIRDIARDSNPTPAASESTLPDALPPPTSP